MSSLIISLDFELFWGVAESRTIEGYRNNVGGEWQVVPKLLDLFRRYDIKATWATVGMLMCRDYAQWRALRPRVLPSYANPRCSTYSLDSVVRDNSKLFFARPLVERILAADGQELASHTYSHFLCDEVGITVEQFKADCECQREIFAEYGVVPTSLVLPRNQVNSEFLSVLSENGIRVYRGNQNHWLYYDGHFVKGGVAGRAVRLVDAYLPISGNHVAKESSVQGLINLPASIFLRPWSSRLAVFESIRLSRIKNAMTVAAKNDGVFHLWWHPHNFGVNIEENMAVLESLLQHYVGLHDKYGMRSMQMGDFKKGPLT